MRETIPKTNPSEIPAHSTKCKNELTYIPTDPSVTGPMPEHHLQFVVVDGDAPETILHADCHGVVTKTEHYDPRRVIELMVESENLPYEKLDAMVDAMLPIFAPAISKPEPVAPNSSVPLTGWTYDWPKSPGWYWAWDTQVGHMSTMNLGPEDVGLVPSIPVLMFHVAEQPPEPPKDTP